MLGPYHHSSLFSVSALSPRHIATNATATVRLQELLADKKDLTNKLKNMGDLHKHEAPDEVAELTQKHATAVKSNAKVRPCPYAYIYNYLFLEAPQATTLFKST